MSNFTLLLQLLLLLRGAALAQAGPAWPRDPATNKIVFTGRLAWPANIGPELRKQALVRRWYQLNLTNDVLLAGEATASDCTYGGVPQNVRFRLGLKNTNEDFYYLYFHVQLVPNEQGMVYRLTDFQIRRGQGDVSEWRSVEDAITQRMPDLQLVLRQFNRRLLAAGAGW